MRHFATRAEAITWIGRNTAPNGYRISAGGYEYEAVSGSTAIGAMGGWDAVAPRTPFHHGAVGDGSNDDRPAFAEMNTAGGPCYLPKPPTSYNVATAIALDNVSVECDPTATWAQLTDSGNITWYGGKVTNDGAHIHRMADRVFVGGAAYQWAGNTLSTDNGSSSVGTAISGPAYLGVNGQVVVVQTSQYGFTSLVRGSELSGTGIIGSGSGLINDKAGGQAWGYIAELQHEAGAFSSNGLEVAAKNKGTDYTYSPYAASYGVFGVRVVASGDDAFGGPASAASTVGLLVIRHYTGLHAWNAGLLFGADAITGTDGSIGSTGTGVAIGMARRHVIKWFTPDNGTGATLLSSVTDNDYRVIGNFIDNGFTLSDGVTGKQFLRAAHLTNGVNYLSITNAATGNAPTLAVLGDDTNANLNLTPLGTGVVNVTTGALQLPSYTVAGLPAATTAGRMIYVSNESGGAVLAFSDGTNWRRVTDRTIIS